MFKLPEAWPCGERLQKSEDLPPLWRTTPPINLHDLVKTSQRRKVNYQTIREEFSNTTTTNTVRDKGTVLLQTARATAINEENSKSTEVRILFDNGSQRSYVTSNLMSRLKLKPVKTETLHLNTFGGNTFRKQSCDVIKLRLKDKTAKKSR